eukprot:CAMPEP_0117648314 /NCGR_PEP_ID=MMETSP0804-20121206/330_1 /TAXON_ID=1074897 /ORGANISM="Tetraselmis astigmatica, Strain CCMP880" /LENGTH=434 /DNA_ID=CAMNT_0005453891 /DNA_START=273 /DNA_END=1578 /DNA_ORIENTATION=-
MQVFCGTTTRSASGSVLHLFSRISRPLATPRHATAAPSLPLLRQQSPTSTQAHVGDPNTGQPVQDASWHPPSVIQTKGVPIHLYTTPEEVEPEALEQLVRLAESPLPVGYVAAMPDVHLGKGIAIGTVFASDKYVCPHAVGVDIGCGMCAVPLSGLHRDDLSEKQLLKIQEGIKQRIPTGFNEHWQPLVPAGSVLDDISHRHRPSGWLESFRHRQRGKAERQLGTLGGGNHFLEVVYDETGQVWVMLHSGSRNIGNETARHHDAMAKLWMEQTGAEPVAGGFNYFTTDSQEGQAYLQDMEWCQQYALENRRAMMDLMLDAISDSVTAVPQSSRFINIHHNYCECTVCQYRDPQTQQVEQRKLWVTRKGATSAADGQLGIIPGSMGVGSFKPEGVATPRAGRAARMELAGGCPAPVQQTLSTRSFFSAFSACDGI